MRVWKLKIREDSDLSTKLPTEGASDDQPKPWLLHSMDMSALNFCNFAMCNDKISLEEDSEGVLIASPNALDSGGVDIFQLPTERRILQLRSENPDLTGMVMSLAMFIYSDGKLCFIAGYEDGRVSVHYHHGLLGAEKGSWKKVMNYKAHTQPVLSLDISPQRDYFITSSADAIIAKLLVPPPTTSSNDADDRPLKTVNTKHAGQQGLSIRSDGKIFATAGWDARVRVYSSKTMKELAVLKWHKDGCCSTTFALVLDDEERPQEPRPSDSPLFASNNTALNRIKQERSLKAQRIHWLAAGGKDGKISLWDIY